MTKNIERYKKILISLGLFVIALLVLYYFIFAYIRNKIDLISGLRQDLASKSNKESNLLSLRHLVQESQGDIDTLNSLIIPKDGDVLFIEKVESLAKNSGLSVTIDNLNLEEIPSLSENGMSILHIRLKGQGTWSAVYLFVSKLESIPFKIKIDRLVMGVSNTDTSKNLKSNWQMGADLSVLKLK